MFILLQQKHLIKKPKLRLHPLHIPRTFISYSGVAFTLSFLLFLLFQVLFFQDGTRPAPLTLLMMMIMSGVTFTLSVVSYILTEGNGTKIKIMMIVILIIMTVLFIISEMHDKPKKDVNLMFSYPFIFLFMGHG